MFGYDANTLQSLTVRVAAGAPELPTETKASPRSELTTNRRIHGRA